MELSSLCFQNDMSKHMLMVDIDNSNGVIFPLFSE